MKVGMNMLLWTTHLTDEHFPLLEKIKQTGFDGVEIPLFEGDEAHYKNVRRVLDDLGLECTTVTVVGEDANPISADPAIRRAAVDNLKLRLTHSAVLGSTLLCGPYHQPLGVFSGGGPTEDEKSWAAEVHREAADAAQQLNVTMGIEYLNRFECYFLTTMKDAVDHVKRVNHPAFRTMYDTFHANIEEKDPIGVFTEFKDSIAHFHVSENDRGTPGKGHVPFLDTFKVARRAGYDGWLTIEAFGRALPDLAAATRVWRDFFPTPDEVYVEGNRMVRDLWEQAD